MFNLQTFTRFFAIHHPKSLEVSANYDTFKNRLHLSENSFYWARELSDKVISSITTYISVVLKTKNRNSPEDLLKDVLCLSPKALALCNTTDKFIKNRTSLKQLIIKERLSEDDLLSIPSNGFDWVSYDNTDLYRDMQVNSYPDCIEDELLMRWSTGSVLLNDLNNILYIISDFISVHTEIIEKPGISLQLCNELSELAQEIHTQSIKLPETAKLFIQDIPSMLRNLCYMTITMILDKIFIF